MRKNTNGNGHSTRTIMNSLSYGFIDQDPVIHAVRSVVDQTGYKLGRIEAESGVSTSTLRHWFGGITKRPRNETVNRVMNALGYEQVFVPRQQSDSKARAPLILSRFPSTADVRSRPRARQFKEDRPNA